MCPPPNVAATTAAAKAPMVGIGVNAQMVIREILMFSVDAKVFLPAVPGLSSKSADMHSFCNNSISPS